MSEKMMNFEEWRESCHLATDQEKDQWLHDIFNAARLGTLPAENAIVVPDVWPIWADKVTGAFIGQDDRGARGETFSTIPRPVPAFVPGYYWVWHDKNGWQPFYMAFAEDGCWTKIGPKIEEPAE